MSLKRKRGQKHPYLSGNFAPIQKTLPLTLCTYEGTIPEELAGGQYVRNGGNPLLNEDLGRDAHWFDGDGMLSGVLFQRSERDGSVQPEFVNQYILTDLYLSTLATPSLKRPILPSIATLVNPLSSLFKIILHIFRAVFLVVLSHLPGSEQAVKRISVVNTAIYYHDGRALATCESGPPMRVQLPGLETVGWYDGNRAEGEAKQKGGKEIAEGFGGTGVLSFLKEFTTGHPKVDPVTGELVLFHNTFAPPYVHYSSIPDTNQPPAQTPAPKKIMNAPVPGMRSAKMMHDFGVSREHVVIMDLPLSLDPLNLLKNRPIVSYDSSQPSRFGVFPRTDPKNVCWFETSACCIFHTANSWDTHDANGRVTAVNMLACRLTSATLVFSAGNIAAPQPVPTQQTVDSVTLSISFDKHNEDEHVPTQYRNTAFSAACGYDRAPALESPRLTEKDPLLRHTPPASPSSPVSASGEEEEQCRLYHYTFSLTTPTPTITSQYALSSLPFEFPTLNPTAEMSAARYVYGCSTSSKDSFGAALGRAVKIDVLLKMDVKTLIARAGREGVRPVTGCVDRRSMEEVLESKDPRDPIKAFTMPSGWYAQEARFVARRHAAASFSSSAQSSSEETDGKEDDGYLLFYAFDESQLDAEGEAPPTAVSELWILDAKDMRTVLARVGLPQRVPYGLHGNWFGEEAIRRQRGVERVRKVRARGLTGQEGGLAWKAWMGARRWLAGLAS